MEIEVSDATTLPEWLQGHVAEGKLNLGAIPAPEDVTGLKTALQKERGNHAAYSKFGTVEEIEAKFADLTEKAKGSGKGAEDAQAKLDAMANDYETKLTAANERNNAMMQRYAAAEMKTELAKAGFMSEAIDDIASAAMGRLQFNDDGTPKVMSADGGPWVVANRPNHEATLADLAKELAEVKSYAVRHQGKGGGGKPAGSQGGKPTNKRSEMSATQKAAFINEHGQSAYLQLPK